jgi:hypothetical protein
LCVGAGRRVVGYGKTPHTRPHHPHSTRRAGPWRSRCSAPGIPQSTCPGRARRSSPIAPPWRGIRSDGPPSQTSAPAIRPAPQRKQGWGHRPSPNWESNQAITVQCFSMGLPLYPQEPARPGPVCAAHRGELLHGRLHCDLLLRRPWHRRRPPRRRRHRRGRLRWLRRALGHFRRLLPGGSGGSRHLGRGGRLDRLGGDDGGLFDAGEGGGLPGPKSPDCAVKRPPRQWKTTVENVFSAGSSKVLAPARTVAEAPVEVTNLAV